MAGTSKSPCMAGVAVVLLAHLSLASAALPPSPDVLCILSGAELALVDAADSKPFLHSTIALSVPTNTRWGSPLVTGGERLMVHGSSPKGSHLLIVDLRTQEALVMPSSTVDTRQNPVGTGSAPQLSLSGRWITFLQPPAATAGTTRLHLYEPRAQGAESLTIPLATPRAGASIQLFWASLRLPRDVRQTLVPNTRGRGRHGAHLLANDPAGAEEPQRQPAPRAGGPKLLQMGTGYAMRADMNDMWVSLDTMVYQMNSMRMWFHSDIFQQNFLFWGYNIGSGDGGIFFATWLLTAGLAFGLEWLRTVHNTRFKSTFRTKGGAPAAVSASTGRLTPILADLGVFAVIAGLTYIVMVLAMYFSVWLLVAVIVGSGIGHFVFTSADSEFEEADCCSIAG